MVVFVFPTAAWVVLCDGIIAAGSRVPTTAINVPIPRPGLEPREIEVGAFSISRVIDTPGAGIQLACIPIVNYGKLGNILDLILGGCNIINDAMDLIILIGINICEEPVITDIGFNSPGEMQATVLLEINKLGRRVGECTRCALEHICRITFNWGGLNFTDSSCDGNVQGVYSSNQSIDWI